MPTMSPLAEQEKSGPRCATGGCVMATFNARAVERQDSLAELFLLRDSSNAKYRRGGSGCDGGGRGGGRGGGGWSE